MTDEDTVKSNGKSNAEETIAQNYSLGLGQLLPDIPANKKSKLSPSEKEELLFIQREKEREAELAAKEVKQRVPIYKKKLRGQDVGARTIRELYASCQQSPTDDAKYEL